MNTELKVSDSVPKACGSTRKSSRAQTRRVRGDGIVPDPNCGGNYCAGLPLSFCRVEPRLFLDALGRAPDTCRRDHDTSISARGNLRRAPAALTFAVLVLQCVIPRAATVRALQATMFLLMAGGVIGLGLHFNGNREFELEMHPGQTGMKLFWETLKGATPALAPGMLIFLGCLGLVCTYQHPALAASGPTNEPAGK